MIYSIRAFVWLRVLSYALARRACCTHVTYRPFWSESVIRLSHPMRVDEVQGLSKRHPGIDWYRKKNGDRLSPGKWKRVQRKQLPLPLSDFEFSMLRCRFKELRVIHWVGSPNLGHSFPPSSSSVDSFSLRSPPPAPRPGFLAIDSCAWFIVHTYALLTLT